MIQRQAHILSPTTSLRAFAVNVARSSTIGSPCRACKHALLGSGQAIAKRLYRATQHVHWKNNANPKVKRRNLNFTEKPH